jgi:hypothetical protein
MEDRLQKVLEKKKVKNNYKHIEVLPTLNDNTSTDTTVNIENPSPSVTSSTKTVQSDKSESSTNTGKNKKPKESVIENFETKTKSNYNTYEDSTDDSKTEEKAKEKCEKLRSRMRSTLKNFGKNLFIVILPIFLIVFILCMTQNITIDPTINKTIGADNIIKSTKFWKIGFALSIMIGISVSYDDGSSKYGDSLSIKRLKKFKGWQQLFVSIADSIKNFFNFISELLFLVFGGDCKYHKNDVAWIRRSTFEFFSIIMAYFLAKYLYFIDNSTAKSYHEFSDENIPFPIKYTLFLFSQAGPIGFYKIAKTYWSEFIKKIGLEAGYFKFIVLFILAVILVYTAIPYFLSCIVKTFEWKVSPSIYYLILIGFVLHLTPDESKKVAAFSGGLLYIFLLLLLLLLAFFAAPLTQLLFVGYIIYYFLCITVNENTDDGDSLNNDTMNNVFSPNEDIIVSIKPENVERTAEKPKVLNFIWCCYLLFFLWKLIELIAFYAVSRKKNISALSGVKSDSCFGVFLAITILAIIIMIAMYVMGTGDKGNEMLLKARSLFDKKAATAATANVDANAAAANYASKANVAANANVDADATANAAAPNKI